MHIYKLGLCGLELLDQESRYTKEVTALSSFGIFFGDIKMCFVPDLGMRALPFLFMFSCMLHVASLSLKCPPPQKKDNNQKIKQQKHKDI